MRCMCSRWWHIQALTPTPPNPSKTLTQMTQRMTKTLENTRFKGCPIVAVAARPGAESGTLDPTGLDALMQVCWARGSLVARLQ